MSYKNKAAEILFGGIDRDGVNTLDNAIRGHYIEALIWALLKDHNKARPSNSQWMNAGVGWGPWDLQRGRHDLGNRVRVQVKIKADKQLWIPQHNRPSGYSLGWNEKDPPKYFSRDFDSNVYGAIDPPPSHRCDLFLLGWHGVRPGQTERKGADQTIPDEYDFLIASVSALAPGCKIIRVSEAFERFGKTDGAVPWSYRELPEALDLAADAFLQTGTQPPA